VGEKTERGKKNHRGSKKKSHQDPRYVGITQDRNVLPLLWGSTGVDYALAWDMRTVESKKRGETGGNERERESARGCVVQARYRKANL